MLILPDNQTCTMLSFCSKTTLKSRNYIQLMDQRLK